MRNKVSIIFGLICILSCNTTKQLQSEYGFSDSCRESYELFSNLLTRTKGGLLEIKSPTEQNYIQLLTSREENVRCWNNSIPEDVVITLFGSPIKKETNPRTKSTVITYYIRTQTCMNFEELSSSDEGCGILEFTFSKEGKPTGNIFYAINPLSE